MVNHKMFLNKSPKTDSDLELDEIKEEEVKRLVRYEIYEMSCVYITSDDLLYDIIKTTRCNQKHAYDVLKKMRTLGLELCRASEYYALAKFASMRGYITDDEFDKINQELKEEQEKEIQEEEDREREFIEKYGPRSQWSIDVRDEFDFGAD